MSIPFDVVIDNDEFEPFYYLIRFRRSHISYIHFTYTHSAVHNRFEYLYTLELPGKACSRWAIWFPFESSKINIFVRPKGQMKKKHEKRMTTTHYKPLRCILLIRLFISISSNRQYVPRDSHSLRLNKRK